MKILVTGGAGFVGSHLADQLIKNGNSVVVADNLVTGRRENINAKAEFKKISIQDKKLERVFSQTKFDAVFHLAAQMDVRKSVADPLFDANTNILGAINLFENCRKYAVPKIIFSSTGGAIYGEAEEVPTAENCPAKPISPYGIAKLAVEQYLYYYKAVHGIDYVSLRYANVYGPRQRHDGEAGVVAIFTSKMIKKEEVFINGTGKQTRDYVFIDDVVRANILALEVGDGGAYNIGTGIETSVLDLHRAISSEICGNSAIPSFAPAREGEQVRSCLDCRRAEKDLGWKPEVRLSEGIPLAVEWFKGGF